MRILAIETSCDETAAAIVEQQNYRPVIISNIVASQMEVHAESGGVIPNIAARLHTEALPEVLKLVTNRKRHKYDAVAVTIGPGLIGSLLVGVVAAKTIAMAQDIPFFGINHLEGHIYSAWLGEELPELPALIVIVSGGHTELILMQRHGDYQHLGATRDDAAGEAFDKVARMLGLGYPGGPAISKLAVHGKRDEYQLPIGLDERDSLEFSFSGLKAAVYNLIQKLPQPLSEHTKADIAASFEETVAKTICRKTVAALSHAPGIRSVCLVGGVAANTHLRKQLEQAVKTADRQVRFVVAPLEYCTDNAAMIGTAAIFKHLFGRQKQSGWAGIHADPNLELVTQ